MELHQRRDFIQEPEGPLNPKGTVQRQTVTNIEIWCECFGKPKEDIKSADSYAIGAIMARLSDWERTAKFSRSPLYGKQRIYRRKQ